MRHTGSADFEAVADAPVWKNLLAYGAGSSIVSLTSRRSTDGN
jgi:hypothetical protein